MSWCLLGSMCVCVLVGWFVCLFVCTKRTIHSPPIELRPFQAHLHWLAPSLSQNIGFACSWSNYRNYRKPRHLKEIAKEREREKIIKINVNKFKVCRFVYRVDWMWFGYCILTANIQNIHVIILTGPIRLTRNKPFFIQLMGGYTFYIQFNILFASFFINSLDTESNVMIERSKFPSLNCGWFEDVILEATKKGHTHGQQWHRMKEKERAEIMERESRE